MREILFKAKRIDNVEWIEGYYFYNPNIDKHFVHNWLSGGLVVVDKDTICQYTGLTDKNGNMVWENDVVRLPELFGSEIGQVVYLAPSFKSYCKAYGYTQLCGEVIGNIFDNADLLKGE